jgi:hypothetical protein
LHKYTTSKPVRIRGTKKGMVNIAEKEKEKKARLVVAWREAYKTESHYTSTKNNKVNRTINKKRAKSQYWYCMRVLGMKREEQ